MRCVECGAETADPVAPCARCGAPVVGHLSVIADPAAGAVGGAAAMATVASAAGQALPEPYVPGRGDEIPARIRRVRRGYLWMAGGAVLGAWALVQACGYFDNLNGSFPVGWAFAAIALCVLAAILVVPPIRLSGLLGRPSDESTATVAACGRGGRMLMLDAPCDGYPSRLKIRLAWWAEPEMLPPGQSVSFYGPPGGGGRVLVSSSAQGRAFTGIGRRQPGTLVGEQAVQGAPPEPGGQRAGWRCLRWGPPVLASLGLVVAVAATVIVAVPYLTGHRTVDQLRAGDCLTGSNLGLSTDSTWPDWVAAVPCTDQHLAEVFFAGNAWPQSAAYPGDKAISDQGPARCATEFKRYAGIDWLDSKFFMIWIPPTGGDDWASGDRSLVCVSYQPGVPMNYSIKRSNR